MILDLGFLAYTNPPCYNRSISSTFIHNFCCMQANEQTVQDILTIVLSLKENLTKVQEDVGYLKEDVGDIKEDIHTMKGNINDLNQDVTVLKQTSATKQDIAVLADRMTTNEQTTQDILTMVQFIQENGATKDDITNAKKELRTEIYLLNEDLRQEISGMATKEALSTVKNDIMNTIDGFMSLHLKLDTEFTALRSTSNRLESHIHQLATHTHCELAS